MSKKTLRFLALLAGIATIIAGVIYFVNSKKKKAEILEEENESETEEDHLDAMDALDLSNLKFSRHYVDLR